MKRSFKVKLQKVHEQADVSGFAVSKAIGASYNTVLKYISNEEVVVDYLHYTVLALCDFYGVDWRDPEIIEVVTESEGENAPDIKTPLPAAG
jgi:hypothetical protein